MSLSYYHSVFIQQFQVCVAGWMQPTQHEEIKISFRDGTVGREKSGGSLGLVAAACCILGSGIFL